MNRELLRQSLDAVADQCAVPQLADQVLRATRRRRARRYVAIPALACLVIAAVVLTTLSLVGSGGQLRPGAGPGALPSRIMPVEESAIASIVSDPIDRAVLAYSRNLSPTGMVIAVGDNGTAYRRLPGIVAGKDVWALSPDGTRVVHANAYGPSQAPTTFGIYVLDLRTGRSHSYPMTYDNFRDLRWSPTGKYVAFDVIYSDASEPNVGKSKSGILDVTTGKTAWLADGDTPVAWLGSEDKLVVEVGYATLGDHFAVVGSDGRALSEPDLRSVSAGQILAASQAISPDGQTMAWVSREQSDDPSVVRNHWDIDFVALGKGNPVSSTPPVRTRPASFVEALGWVDATHALLEISDVDGDTMRGPVTLASVSMTDGSVVALVTAGTDAMVGQVQVAADVVADR